MRQQPRLYGDLASWFHLLTAPASYGDGAAYASRVMQEAASIPIDTVLELGSGGGNNASHLKAKFEMTLTDLSPDMLELSRTINSECEHIQGDMRALRLGRLFDAIFISDAIMYMTSEADLRAAIETAYIHCRPGGVLFVEPDHVRESFAPYTDHGGHDGSGRSLRYVEWATDPDPEDTSYTVDFAYLLRGTGGLRVEQDRHIFGLFPEATWLRLLGEEGFQPKALTDSKQRRQFVGVREGDAPVS
jgi:ubiquinone/menaquinone biosynthesis C-methylase UbiE